MNSKVETVNVKLEMAKLAAAGGALLLGVVGFYAFPGAALPLRIVGLLVCFAIAVAIGLQTGQGRAIWAFFSESQVELRKVVWPSQQETVQTTGLIIVCVLVFAVVMWALDFVLGWGIQYLVGHGG